ncbi:MAG: M23 family metallopeptidase [Anaerolineales bacterium]|nr:M23 family metallopeptidase [Anaerolineales bacterium]
MGKHAGRSMPARPGLLILMLTSTLILGLAACQINLPALGENQESGPGGPVDEPARPAPTATPPMRFTIPTPRAEPASIWRPPLYPIPWAISQHDHFYFNRPIAADQVNWPLADYRYGGIFFANVVHTGVDIPADEWAPVLAAAEGMVVWSGWGLFSGWHLDEGDPYGLAIAIRHDFGYQNQPLYTVYAHMNQLDVTEGQWVELGQQVGLVGITGATTGPHLHFEVRSGLNSFHHTYNPELWMAPPQGWGVLVGRILDNKRETLNHYTVDVRSLDTGVLRSVKTYGLGATNGDPYYNENMALSDLPAGLYKVSLSYKNQTLQHWVMIYPGQVTYFSFNGSEGFSDDPPEEKRPDFLPITPTPTATPK